MTKFLQMEGIGEGLEESKCCDYARLKNNNFSLEQVASLSSAVTPFWLSKFIAAGGFCIIYCRLSYHNSPEPLDRASSP